MSPDNCEWEKKCLTTTYMRRVIEIKTTYKHRVKTLEATCNFSLWSRPCTATHMIQATFVYRMNEFELHISDALF